MKAEEMSNKGLASHIKEMTKTGFFKDQIPPRAHQIILEAINRLSHIGGFLNEKIRCRECGKFIYKHGETWNHFEDDVNHEATPPGSPVLYPIMRYFGYRHLPEHLQETSKRFHDLALDMAESIPDNPGGAEKAAGLRKLLEAKDCFVRANLK